MFSVTAIRFWNQSFLPTLGALLLLSWALSAAPARAQENIDKADPKARSAAAALMTMRVRMVTTSPPLQAVRISWRRGGEGLGGKVTRGEFTAEDKSEDIAVGSWSAWTPVDTVVGGVKGWEFPTIVVAAPPPATAKKGARRGKSEPITASAIEFEFAEKGKSFKTFSEPSPKGATAGFAFPGSKLSAKGSADPDFVANLQGLSTYARARRERLEKVFPQTQPVPSQFGILGHLAGFGQGSGYGIRHCNPEIVAEECRALQILGINGLVNGKGISLADAAGMGQCFRHIFWGGQSGHPLAACPFVANDPTERVKTTVADIHAVGAKEGWAQLGDEIGVAAKEHLANCPRCAEEFRTYLRSLGIQPADVGQASWELVKPYPIWPPEAPAGKKGKAAAANMPPAPTAPAEALRYYYTYRFMTYATIPSYRPEADQTKAAGVPLFSMMGPAPSWGGHSLDWHEFYDRGANTAVVWETSNRDPQVWQWESYLGDIARGISLRHDIPIGCLIKPHRGAPQQRMLSVVSRGVTNFEWYTYGPDYVKGDSFSQSPELLVQVARADRFLGQAENWLYKARWAGKPEVAFVTPRSSEIWGHASPLAGTAFEDAKWVYLALAHAHVPVDVLSEQQLAEGKLSQYKVIYIVGPNLRRDAAGKVMAWVESGGTLWTDALGLSRDEANQPAPALANLLAPADRAVETWGSVDSYKAAGLHELTETAVPPGAAVTWQGPGAWGKGDLTARVGREPLNPHGGDNIAKFADGKAAVARFKVGSGEVIANGTWAGLTYSAKVRRNDFDMQADFSDSARALIAAAALERKVYRPAVPSNPLVEAVMLDKDGRRSIALINWSYRRGEEKTGRHPHELQPCENLRVMLPGLGSASSIRSLVHGKLAIQTEGNERSVILPKLEEIDLLVVE